MKQRIIALILVLCSAGAMLVPQVMAEEKPVSRIEWVQQLVKTFDMTVEENNYPDNYYSDMNETSTGYRDLLVAVEFGVIDLEAGAAFAPDQPATREFAAHTLNFCLGFQLDEGAAYTYAESAEVSYPDDLQVAANRGWFALSDGKILPQQALTSEEAAAMLKDAAAVMGLTDVSEGYNSVYKFLDGVVVVPDGTEVSVQDDTVTIANCPVAIQSGDLFVVYQNAIPVGYQAASVSVSGRNTVISAARAEDDTIFEDVDAQGVVEADLNNVTALDGSDIGYYVEDLDQEFVTYAQARVAAQASGTAKPKVELTIKRTVTLSSGVKLSIDAKAKNAVIRYNVNAAKGIASAKLEFDFELHHVVKCDLAGAMQSDEVKLFLWGIPGIGGVTFSLEMEASMASDAIQKWHVSQEIAFSTANGIRFTPKIDKKEFTLSTEGTAKLGVAVKFGITEMPVIKGYSYLRAGATCKLQQKTYDATDAPLKCVHFAAYLYADAGLEASAKFFNYKKTVQVNYPLLNEKNSPVRIATHYEDGKSVPKCTRGDVESWFGGGGFRGYYTPGDSRYGSSGWASGFGGTGYNKSGEPIVIYTYTLDDDENATITSYKGNATSLIIPSKLDGYTVVAIGDGAFKGNTALTDVVIPDSVTEIGQSAFSDCVNLTSVKIPDSVTFMGESIFANCTSLTDVTLPSSRENIPSGTFEGCTALEKIVLPENVTAIRSSAFKGCTALKEIVWSKAPELIESNAFYNCDVLTEMDIPATVTSVGNKAFYDCDGLTKITIPDSVTSLGSSVFYDCDALTDVKLGTGITTIPDSAFRHCDALEQLTVPRRVTAIKDNAFKDSVKFSSITIPRSVTSISANAFSYPDKMTIYGVAGTYAETFAGANSIKFVNRQVPAASASLSQTALILNKGVSGQLTLTVTPDDFTDEVVYKSSNTAVATVSDTGLVKAVGVGTATIKVSAGKVSASCKVTVLQPVTSISLNRSSLTMEALETYQLQASVYPSDAADRRIQWSSSDPAVATVDENGLVTALKKGTATITAAALDGSGVTRTCAVTVSNTAYICTKPEQMESPHDYPDSCTDVWLYTTAPGHRICM